MITQLIGHPVLAWLLTWMIHSTLLFGAVSLFEGLKPRSAPRLREYLWRVAIFVSLISATAVTLNYTGYTKAVFEIPVAHEEVNIREIDPAAQLATQSSLERKAPRIDTSESAASSVADSSVQWIKALNPSALWIFWCWGLIVVFLFVRLFRTYAQAIGYLGNRTVLKRTHRAHRILGGLMERIDYRRQPRLTECPKVRGPISLPGGEICLPEWTLATLNNRQLEGVLAHELIHCVRHDPLYILFIDSLRRILFMQPFMHLAARRLSELAELVADERAVELTGDQRAIAESIAECAGRLNHDRLSWGVGMAQNRSSLMHRIRRLLHPQRFTVGKISWQTQFVTALIGFGFSLALPGFVVAAIESGSRGSSSTIITDDDGRLRIVDLSITDDDYVMDVKGMGDFSLNDDETDVARMANAATLEIKEVDDIERRIRFEKEDGTIERTYWIEGDPAEIDINAGDWLAEILPQLMRETGINVAERASRLHANGGADRILDELRLIRSDRTTRLYASWLVNNDDLDDRDYGRLLDAVEDIDSDYESRTVLIDIATNEKLDDDRASRLLDIGTNVESDYELRVLLQHLINNSDVETLATSRLIELIASIDSDYEMRTAFSSMIEDSDIPAEWVPGMISISGSEIGSDYELRVLLQSLAEQINSNPDSALAYVGATLEIESDYERREALAAFAEFADRDSSGWEEAVKATATIGGDYERAEALIRIAERMPDNEEMKTLYRRIANTLESHERKRVLDAAGYTNI